MDSGLDLTCCHQTDVVNAGILFIECMIFAERIPRSCLLMMFHQMKRSTKSQRKLLHYIKTTSERRVVKGESQPRSWPCPRRNMILWKMRICLCGSLQSTYSESVSTGKEYYKQSRSLSCHWSHRRCEYLPTFFSLCPNHRRLLSSSKQSTGGM